MKKSEGEAAMATTFFSTFGSCRTRHRPARKNHQRSARPTYTFEFHENWTFDRTAFPGLSIAPDVFGVAFEVNLSALAKQARRALASVETDLVWLATAVYLADRCSPRHPYGMSGPTHWRRRIHLRIPVRSVDVWTKSEAALVNVLEYLSEDDWTFEFIPGRSAFGVESQKHFPRMPRPTISWTALFSGGLDSLAGALRWFGQTDGIGLLVSGQTQNRIASGQRSQVERLRERFSHQVEHVGIGYGFPDKQRHELAGFESTQRTRSFIHTTLGSVAALAAGCDELLLFENGFGALNLPCDSAQFGSQNSRGTHPVYLRRMAGLIQTVFEKRFVITNPFTFSTKAQMLKADGVRHFGPLLRMSFSCDRFPNYNHAEAQCGWCPSCLVRRLAFHASGLPDDDKSYSTNLFNPLRPLQEQEFLALAKLDAQSQTLASCLAAEQSWTALCARWPDLLRTDRELDAPVFRDGVVALLRQHLEEWTSFRSAIDRRLLPLAA